MKDAGQCCVGRPEMSHRNSCCGNCWTRFYSGGVWWTDFPGQKVQVSGVSCSTTSWFELRNKYVNTLYSEHFKKAALPHRVLFFDEKEASAGS